MPSIVPASDLDFVLADASASSVVRFGAIETSGILRREDAPAIDPLTGASVGIRRTTLRVRAGVLTGLTADSTITVDDVSYLVRSIGQIDLAGSQLLVLAEATA